jgi:hypothetical protein
MGCLFPVGLSGTKSRLLLSAALGSGLAEGSLQALFSGPRAAVAV